MTDTNNKTSNSVQPLEVPPRPTIVIPRPEPVFNEIESD